MKKFFAIIILSISLTTSSNADDIRDFQIEGMSIGDSLLNHFNEKFIKDRISKTRSNYKYVGKRNRLKFKCQQRCDLFVDFEFDF